MLHPWHSKHDKDPLMVPAVEDTARLLLRGQQNRHTAATNMNRESSRSHSVFTCVVESKTTDEAGLITMLSARVNLVDLAGEPPACLSLCLGHVAASAECVLPVA